MTDLIRIGDKLISRDKIGRAIARVLERRAQGLSQQDVAKELGSDRTFISRLETLGEVRRGGKLAVIGFPVANVEEIRSVALAAGVDFVLLMNERERWDYIQGFSGADLFNQIMSIIAEVRDCAAVVFLASDMRIRVLENILGADRVVGIELGPSPITEDKFVDPQSVAEVLRNIQV